MLIRTLFVLCAMTTVLNPIEGMAGEIQFVEQFVLASDRSEAIEQLIPGTDDYYFYQSLHLQQTQQFGEVEKLLKQWQQRHGRTQNLLEVQHRQMILTYSQNPKKTLDYLIRELGPNLSHQQEQLESKPKLPSKLDPSKISYAAFKKEAFRRHRDLDGFTQRALDAIPADDLDSRRRRHLLSRLDRPTHPQLVEMILADLKQKDSRGFGSLKIHRQLLLSQLDELISRRPQLENETKFVNIYLQKLQPNADIDWKNNPKEFEAYLSRQWDYVKHLNASHNSLKAHVLYNWLVLNEKQGKYNKRRFFDYLALPRRANYIQPRMLENADARRYSANLQLNPGPITELPIIGNDEPLVRRYLLHFFQKENSFSAYLPYLQDEYAERIFAEAKITSGLGNPEKWYSLLPPAQYQALRDRVDIDFAATNPDVFRASDAVQLDVDVKNVDKLIVKVYEINTRNYYQQHRRPVNTDIQLDGLIANHEETHEYDDAPVIRERRHFTFPQLQKPGVYVIDFIGNGKSSRAVIRKGTLHHIVKTTADGHLFTVFKEDGKRAKDVSIWMSGQNYESEPDGTVLIPFSTSPGRQPIVLTHNGFSSFSYFKHQAETYSLNVAAFIDRESLVQREEAVLMLRPELRLSDSPVAIGILENVQVTIQSTNLDGVNAEKVFEDVKLLESKDTPLVFLVPDRLASMQVTLQATITDARKKQHKVNATHKVDVNRIDASNRINDVHLTKIGDGYMVQLLGKTGEARPHRAVQLQVRHRDFTNEARFSLATNENGIIDLGQLSNITSIKVQGPNLKPKTWTLRGDRRTARRSIHGVAGETIQVPHMLGKGGLKKSEISLIEMRGRIYAIDASKSVSVKDHFVELKNLKAGNYSLQLAGQRYRIRVTDGDEQAGYAYGDYRRLEQRPLKPIQLTSVKANAKNLEIQVENASKFTRVHVYATRFVPAFDSFAAFSRVRGVEPVMLRVPTQRSLYMAGRKLGEELQYVIERGYATKYPGNMLERPTLLLNSWPMRSTETATQTAQDGEDFGAAADDEAALDVLKEAQSKRERVGNVDEANLNFLSEGSMLIANQSPDENGKISIPLKDLGPHHHFHVIAVDPIATVYRDLALSEIDTPIRDMRLKNGLDPEKHFTQQKTITTLAKGEQLEIADVSTGRFDTYDNLGGIFALYSTLSNNEVLQTFQFILKWPQLSTDEKKEKYSEFACHELNFFLFKKDRAYFDEVVQPYIANKHHKTFLDLWLLEADLTHFLQPWEYAQLNTAERLLLGERIDGEDERVRRMIEDLFGLIPRDVNRWNKYFETAIAGKALDNTDKFGFVEQKSNLATAQQFGGMGGGGAGGRSLQLQSRFAVPEAAASEAIVMEAAPAAPAMKAESMKRRLSRQRKLAEMEELDADGIAEDYAFYDRSDLVRRQRQLYEKLEKTKEWAENNYYRLPIEQQNTQLVEVNDFWNDYAQHEKDAPFFSINWAVANRNFTEMMFALSLLDLPFEETEHQTEFADSRMTLTSASPMIVFQEQIREATSADEASSILITQNFFKADDRYQMVRGERRDKFVTEEFLAQTVYGCQVVLTNPTSSQRRVQLLLQIPHDSMPASGAQATKTINLDLPAFHTHRAEYFFYFPAAGEFRQFPAHVAQEETLLASATPTTFRVVDKPTNVDTQSWDYVSQFGSDQEVIEFLNKNNVFELNLGRIGFRMKNKQFFETVTEQLQERHAYSHELWAYALKHNDSEAVATYLKNSGNFLSRCGEALDSELVTVDPVERKTFQHLDYKPLVNARAHRLGADRKILNNRFDQQYHRLLEVLKYRRELDDQEMIAMTYYLLLQDRIGDAIAMFSNVQRSNLESHLQYDYFAAYLDCFQSEPELARSIVTQYLDYPVPKWQKAFASIKSMLDELDGENYLVVDEKDRTQAQTAAAAEQSNFEFTVEDKEIRLAYQNVEDVQVNYYLIDLELLFSSNPFVQKFSSQFSHVKPNQTAKVALPEEAKQHAISLPKEFHNRNLLVEIVADGITRSQVYFSNSLNVQVSENYGQLKVTESDSGKPVAKTYVKCYAEMQDGRTLFYKDGYTDLRGRFDYSSLSTNELDFVKRFSLLVLDDQRGGLVREAIPPKR